MEKEILNCKEKYPKRALLIINPVSGKKLVIRYIPDIIRRLMDSGYLVTTAVTSCRGEATEIAAQLGADYDLVCCTGGDGTLNEVISGLASSDTEVASGTFLWEHERLCRLARAVNRYPDSCCEHRRKGKSVSSTSAALRTALSAMLPLSARSHG